MKRILNIYGARLQSSSAYIIGFLVLGVLTIVLWQAHLVTGWQFLGLIAYLSGMLDTALLIWLLVLITLRSHASATSQKVLKALIYTLERDPDPGVRSKAAVGLAELELEQEKRTYHQVHNKLDNMLFVERQ
jgi:hypothetical protein